MTSTMPRGGRGRPPVRTLDEQVNDLEAETGEQHVAVTFTLNAVAQTVVLRPERSPRMRSGTICARPAPMSDASTACAVHARCCSTANLSDPAWSSPRVSKDVR